MTTTRMPPGARRPVQRPAALAPVSSPTTDRSRLVILPRAGWRWFNAGELWRSRELIFFLAWRDVTIRYRQTGLGIAWAVLQPLTMMIVFSLFFGRMTQAPSVGPPYYLFALAGLLPWNFFASAIAAAGQSVVGSERLITKVYFPRLAVPIAAVAASVVDLLIGFALLLGLMAFQGFWPGPGMLLIPVIFALLAVLAIGIGTLLSALNVAYRDFRHAIPFLIQLGFFATPTIYLKAEGGASGLAPLLLAVNPMIALVDAFRAATLGGPIPWVPLTIASVDVLAVALIGGLYFRKVEDGFADII